MSSNIPCSSQVTINPGSTSLCAGNEIEPTDNESVVS